MTSRIAQPTLIENESLVARAQRVVPGGVHGHLSRSFLWEGAPQFVARADGARFTDVDGNGYLDLMCSWGPVLHGHRHPKIEEAVAHQQRQVDTGNGPAPIMVELAELLVETVDHADWAMLAKNGSDATTMCLSLARAETGRKMILVAEGAYHGALPWCNPNPRGSIPADRASLDYYTHNDLAGLRMLAEQHRDDLAGIIVSAFRHDAGHDQNCPRRRSLRVSERSATSSVLC